MRRLGIIIVELYFFHKLRLSLTKRFFWWFQTTLVVILLAANAFVREGCAAENAEQWRAVTRVRGTITLEEKSWIHEAGFASTPTTNETRETAQVHFLMVSDHGSATLLWRAESATITGSIQIETNVVPYGRSTTEADFSGVPERLSDFTLMLDPFTGVWQILSPGNVKEKYPVVTTSYGDDPQTNTELQDIVPSTVFNGTVTGKPVMTSANFKEEDTIADRPSRGSSTIGQVRFWPELDDVEVEVTIEGYANWRPFGSVAKPTEAGNHLMARATLLPKGGRAQNLPKVKGFRFALLDTSREPGVAINWPLGATDKDYDLRLTAAPAFAGTLADNAQEISIETTQEDEHAHPFVLAQIDSYDFGGRASLSVICTLADGREVVGQMKGEGENEELIRLPKMLGPDWIAEVWRKDKKVEKLEADSDEEKVEGQEHNGDGYTLYEEYRGWVEAGKHIEGAPDKKDFFVLNEIGADAKGGIALFERVSKLRVHSLLQPAEMSEIERLMNGNHRDAPHRQVDQHGVYLVNTSGQGSFGAGTEEVKNNSRGYTAYRPGLVSRVRVETKGRYDGLFSNDRTASFNVSERDASFAYDRGVAHELLHTVGADHHGEGEDANVFYFQAASDPNNPTHRVRFTPDSPGKDEIFLEQTPLGRPRTPAELKRTRTVTLIWEDTRRDVAESLAAEYERGLAAERGRRAANPPSEDVGGRAARMPYYEKDASYWRETDLYDSVVTSVPKFSMHVTIGDLGQADSGNELCLMRYYFANAYPVKGRENTYYLVRPGPNANRAGRELCTSPKGTGANASSHSPQSRFGDAAEKRGNCFSQICPNDAIPPRKL